MPITGWAKHKHIWIASWTSHFEPTLPEEWAVLGKPWTFWQWSAKNQLGQDYGVATKSIDLNRFNGTAADFMHQYNLTSLPNFEEPPPPTSPEPPSPVPEPVPSETRDLLSFEVIVPALHIRSGPGTYYPIIGDLRAGDIIIASNVSAPLEAWIQIGEDRWCAVAYNGSKFLKKVSV